MSLSLKKLHFPVHSKRKIKYINEKAISQLLPGLPLSWSARLQESQRFSVFSIKNCQATSSLELQNINKLFCHFLVRKQPDESTFSNRTALTQNKMYFERSG